MNIRDELIAILDESDPEGGTFPGQGEDLETFWGAQADAILASPLISRIRDEERLDFAGRLTRMGVYTFNIHDIRKYAGEKS